MFKENQTKNQNRELTKFAMLLALSIILGYFKIPLFPPLKLDFSEIVILYAMFEFKVPLVVLMTILRSGIRWLINPTATNVPFIFFGELVAIYCTLTLILAIYLDFKLNKKKHYIISVLNYTLIPTVLILVANALFFIPTFISGKPAYYTTHLMPIEKYLKTLASVYLPFNLIKYFIVAVVGLKIVDFRKQKLEV